MVFFTCSSCGASLKKNQVDKHCFTKCRDCPYVTCIDCLQDFPGDTYASHTKCITENERYGGENYVPKASANKGEKKQMAWIELVQSISSSNSDPDIKRLLSVIQNHDNVPRKRSKFVNFVKNIARNTNPATVNKTFDLFEIEFKRQKEESVKESSQPSKDEKPLEKEDDQQVSKTTEKDETKFGVKKFKGSGSLESKKRKHSESVDEKEEETSASKTSKFDWENVIETCLKKKDGSLCIKKLKKKVLQEYLNFYTDTHKTQEELYSKLDKKLKKNKKFKVLKDKVSFVTV